MPEKAEGGGDEDGKYGVDGLTRRDAAIVTREQWPSLI